MVQYAEYCGWALARAHAQAGQPALTAGYLGKGDQFDEALTDFATAYAEQNESDYEALVRATRRGPYRSVYRKLRDLVRLTQKEHWIKQMSLESKY
jgi:hypothetical protein